MTVTHCCGCGFSQPDSAKLIGRTVPGRRVCPHRPALLSANRSRLAPADKAAGPHQGRLRRSASPPISTRGRGRSRRPFCQLVRLRTQYRPDFHCGRTNYDRIADFQIEPREQRRIDRRAERAVMCGERFREAAKAGCSTAEAVQRIGGVEQPSARSIAVRPSAGPRHCAQGPRRRTTCPTPSRKVRFLPGVISRPVRLNEQIARPKSPGPLPRDALRRDLDCDRARTPRKSP